MNFIFRSSPRRSLLLGTPLAAARLLAWQSPWREIAHSCPVFRADRSLMRLPAVSRAREEDLGAGVTLHMGAVPGGVFEMGSTVFNTGSIHATPLPLRTVRVRGFEMGVFPVTRAQWRRVSQLPRVRDNIFAPTGTDREVHPMEGVLFPHAEEFCARLAAFTRRPYRLPSEAEWEYACRAGTTGPFHFGAHLTREVANINDGSVAPLNQGTARVGSFNAPNRFGLHDMHGQVNEWCADFFNPTYDGAPLDGSAWLRGDARTRLFRGGGYLGRAETCRSSERARFDTCCSASGIGFRVALDATSQDFGDPQLTAAGVVHGAAGTEGPVSPGQLISLYGDFRLKAAEVLDASPVFPRRAGGGRLVIGGMDAPLLFAGPGQVNAVVPYGVRPGEEVAMYWVMDGQSSFAVTRSVVAATPELFAVGERRAAAIRPDGSLVTDGSPARPGEVVSFFGTGAGALRDPVEDGSITAVPPGAFRESAEVEIGATPAEVLYFGPAPGLVAGVFQLNVRVPAGIPGGDVTVWVRMRDGSSRAAVALPVR